MHALEKRKSFKLTKSVDTLSFKNPSRVTKEPGLQKLKNELKKAQERKTNSCYVLQRVDYGRPQSKLL